MPFWQQQRCRVHREAYCGFFAQEPTSILFLPPGNFDAAAFLTCLASLDVASLDASLD
jgi:hypothetical protein